MDVPQLLNPEHFTNSYCPSQVMITFFKKYILLFSAIAFFGYVAIVPRFQPSQSSHVVMASPTPITSSTPTVAPTLAPQIIYVKPQIVVPSVVPPTPQPTTQPITNITYVNPTATPTVAPTPTPVPDRITVVAENVVVGDTAWTTVQRVIGIEHLTYTDYGGDLGIFITGFYGRSAGDKEFWSFYVNGDFAPTGVSSYQVKEGDKLTFVLTPF